MIQIGLVTPEDGRPILEVELFEPSLYLRHTDDGPDRFVTAIEQRLTA